MSAALPSFDALAGGDKRALALALAETEARPWDSDVVSLLDRAYQAPRAHVVGVTGPPGVGKSTLLGALIAHWRGEGHSVGVIAVDPSSRRSGGALLGDRTRIPTDPADAGVFIRSMAARERLGGLSEQVFPAMVLMRAAFDRVVIETVGVGQSEQEIADVADTVVFCIQPASGDSLQFMKAGIMELPDIMVVTKADLGAPATRAKGDAEGALGLSSTAGNGWSVPVLLVSARDKETIAALAGQIERHSAHVGRTRREAQTVSWMTGVIKDVHGRAGLASLSGNTLLRETGTPFQFLDTVLGRLGPLH